MKKILSIAFAALLATSSFAQKSETLLERNQLAKTPPMGWMTWNLFKGDISEQMERHRESSRNQGVCIEISYKLGSLSK